ncbi:MAG: heat-inducible transcriptional repressor HrcA [Thermoanaerobaculum sp.]|nr:heat-inducible transcriptional repressor HrcA [Thermoanaerobaculum sp.]MDW7967239.1 heat-inducible transcriptional repressor HrcA [Thermoanaerobaculum sp.]
MGSGVELSARERLILCEAVALYLQRGEPVASGLLAQVSRTGLSAASLRNIMAELEEKGLLEQPHTSAGRVPTDEALRVYVEVLVQHAALPVGEAEDLAARLPEAGSLDELLLRSSQVLAEKTAEVGLAAAPAPKEASLAAMHFVKVAKDRVMAVVVTQGGFVDSRLLSVERDYTPEELERISNYCCETFRGLRLTEARRKLEALVAEERAQYDTLLAGVVALTRRALEGELEAGGELFLQGAEHLLAKAGPRELVAVRDFFRALADKSSLLQLLDNYLTAPGPRVVFGRELAFDAEGKLSLIVTSFHLASGEEGLVGVVGFKRMDYPRIVPMVDFVGRFIAALGVRRSWGHDGA